MLIKRAAEVRAFAVDFSDKLHPGPFGELTDTDELLTGTPTVEEIGGSVLVISGAMLTDAEWILEGIPSAKEKAVQFTVAGGIAGTTYTLRITATSNATNVQTLIREVELRVI